MTLEELGYLAMSLKATQHLAATNLLTYDNANTPAADDVLSCLAGAADALERYAGSGVSLNDMIASLIASDDDHEPASVDVLGRPAGEGMAEADVVDLSTDVLGTDEAGGMTAKKGTDNA